MERNEIIATFAEFLREYYYSDLAKAIADGKTWLEIDFSILDKFSPDLADSLLEEPEETLPLFENTLKEIDLPNLPSNFKLRFYNLPDSRNIRIRNLRSEHIGKFIVVDGVVKRASEVRPEVAEAIFECPECGEKITVIQKEKNLKPPIKCPVCGNRKGFRMVDQKLYDARWIVVEEPFEITTGERPSTLVIYLKEDLVSPKMQSKTDPGSRIKVTGILKELPRLSRGKRSRQMEIYLEANHVEALEIGWEEVEITPEDEKKIKELAKDPQIYEKLVASLAPSIYGLEEIKEAIILQMFGGEPHVLPDGTRIRGNIHILLVGDPSTAKSQLLKLVSQIMPRAKYASGTAVTGAGLTATVVRDEQFLGGWVLEAGALVLANKSICCIDEFSKVSKEDLVKLQEAMSLESISIAKASIVATLPAQTAILAGANPKLGRFDPYIPIKEQIDVNDILLSRFDLKFALRDIPNPELDRKLAEHILHARHVGGEPPKPVIDIDLLRKYIAYARANIHPKMSKEAGEKLMEFYLKMRSKATLDSPIPITLRQYDALIRLAEASAKVRLSNVVEVQDAERAIKLMKASLRQFGLDPETGYFDIDRAEGGMPASQRGKIRTVLDTIEELENLLGKNIPEAEIIKRAKEKGVPNVEDILKKMKEEGLIFSPKPGFIQKI
ncbi:MAG: minichromosome maintenance protein MCM [Candidatus Aenigmarchaeota archaeon]|nr:minichromosome maintenance protein MCM [Candidatus Aenigmarchaeota archaeon]